MRIPQLSQATGLLSLTWLLAETWLSGGQAWALKKELALPTRYTFTIDPKTSVADLLPVAPDLAPLVAPWLVEDLSSVPEIRFQKTVIAPKEKVDLEKLSDDERQKLVLRLMEEQDKAAERMAHGLAKINHLNKEGRDHFLRTLLKSRPDLAGLPFAMDDACRTGKDDAKLFLQAVSEIRDVLSVFDAKTSIKVIEDRAEFTKRAADDAAAFWACYGKRHEEGEPALIRARIAALVQMLGPDTLDKRKGLVSHLARLKEPEAAKALTRLAVFSAEADLREAALAALKDRRDQADAAILLHGLRYPWPAIARQAADAIVKLERRDLLPEMVSTLERPDPRAPVAREGKRVVREVVRLNHHHNCILCHAPANTPDVNLDGLGRSSDIAVGAASIPGQPLPSQSFSYNPNASPDTFVRVDVNYLRQDFSLMQAVKNADPWPETQRFDFLVRTREATEKEANDYDAWRAKQAPDYQAPNHVAALQVLRALTGRADVAPTASAWRTAIER